MRKLLLALIACALPALAFAQVPARLGYQGRLVNASGTPVSGVVPITFSIHAAADGGPGLWTETQQLAPTGGYYATFLGAATPIPETLFDGRSLFLQVTVDGDALSPRQEIGSVPYALTCQNLDGGTVNASRISVDGVPIVAADGSWIGPATPTDTGTQLIEKINDAATLGQIEPDRVAVAAFTGGANLVPDAFFQSGLAFWSVLQGAGAVVDSPDALAGDRVFQNDPNALAALGSDALIPASAQATYVVRGSFRRPNTAGAAGTISLGVRLWDASMNELTSASGWWYLPVDALSLGDTAWHTFTATFGASTTQPLPADARFMSVGALLNQDGSVAGNRAYQVTGLSLTEDAAFEALGVPLYARGTGLNHSATRAVRLGSAQLVNSTGRGLHLLVLDRQTLAVQRSEVFDVYAVREGPADAAMAAALTALDHTSIVVVTSFDAWENLGTTVRAQLIRCGASSGLMNGIGVATQGNRHPYALVGICGVGDGMGHELLYGSGPTDPLAELSTRLLPDPYTRWYTPAGLGR